MSLNKMMDEFNTQYAIVPVPLTRENAASACHLAHEELKEAYEEVDKLLNPDFNRHHAVKELTDLLYATSQKLRIMGVDVDLALELVHKSNMSKAITDESIVAHELSIAKERYPDVIAREALGHAVLYSPVLDKVVKPTVYELADITPALPQ